MENQYVVTFAKNLKDLIGDEFLTDLSKISKLKEQKDQEILF